MASAGGRISTAANNVASDCQSLIADMRKAIGTFKSMAMEYEMDGNADKVKSLEAAVLELLDCYNGCARFADAVQTVGSSYRPSDQPTNFRKLIEEEVKRRKTDATDVDLQRNPLFRQFKEAIWNVHHTGQPMPGEEQEEIVMTCTQSSILNVTCPLTGKPIIELVNPVRSLDCKHIYERDPILHYIRTKKPQPQCPVAGCPRVLQAEKVACDSLLPVEIEELRSSVNAAAHLEVLEDEDDTELEEDN